MNLKSLGLIALIVLASCKDNKTAETVVSVDYSEKELDVTTSIYPENVASIFAAHGGLDTWRSMQTLKFTMPRASGDETTTTDLHNRYSLIEMTNHTIGYDGENVWLNSKEDEAYKGNAKFYYNLMFYFYAMPFILADDGIVYQDVDPLLFEGIKYPGIKISYESGVGESPDDEYILYYDSKTNEMVWLGYTVTYFSKQKEKEFHFIKYTDWQKINGLKLPKRLTWYEYKDNKPTTKRNDLDFTNVLITDSKNDASTFTKPKGAEVIN
ncbi:MAG: hypothetical protein V7719_13455 [Psychroserpens sp.]|uniref:hypothetical protein n=1 Tax=Psychroserpens sp. TaxID=2020870 RepID=UPI0030024AF4